VVEAVPPPGGRHGDLDGVLPGDERCQGSTADAKSSQKNVLHGEAPSPAPAAIRGVRHAVPKEETVR